MTARRSRLLVACTALAALAAGCRGAKDRELAEQVIRRYNRAVIEAHLTGSTAELGKAAAEREVERIAIFVSAIRGQGQVLEESLEKLRVKDAVFEQAKARVLAEERWLYQRLDGGTRRPVSERSHREYAMTYLLARRGGGWVVDRVEFARPSRDVSP